MSDNNWSESDKGSVALYFYSSVYASNNSEFVFVICIYVSLHIFIYSYIYIYRR